MSILQIVILPICLGVALRTFLPRLARAATDYTPAVSALAISLIIGGVIGASKAAILANVGVIFLVVILHNCLGYALGFAVARLVGLPWKKQWPFPSKWACRIPDLPWACQSPFAAMPTATVPGAVFSAWHNISGAVLAYLYLNVLNPRFDPDYEKNRPSWNQLLQKPDPHKELP